MKKKIYFSSFMIALITVLLVGCTIKDPAPARTKVKYEITGNFSGQLIIVYNDNNSGNTVLNNITLPWSKELNYPSTVAAIGIGAQSSVAGVAGQTANMKISVNGTIVKLSNGTAGSLGEMILPALAHSF